MAVKYHLRSISLPARSHPSTARIEQELHKLKTLEAAASPATSGSICIGLSGLLELYNCMDDLLNMASTQEVLFRLRNEQCLEEILDGSVKLLDTCSIARDTLLQFKEQVRVLESAFRRRKGDSSTESSIADYICLRKNTRKQAKKLSLGLKQMDNKIGSSSSLLLNQDHHTSAVIRVITEVNAMNSSIFQSLLLFMTTPVSKPKQSKWSMVSKLIHKGAIACEDKLENMNELEMVDDILNEASKIQIAHEKLEALEINIEELENFMERVFRRLIKTRSSLLNIICQ